MFCVKCGKEVKNGTKFCTNCGAELGEVKEVAKDDKLTYSQNSAIETTSNPTPVKVAAASTGDGKGTASLVLGIVSFVVWCVAPITSIIGLILGICAKKSGKKTAGIILNSIALGFSIIGLIVFFAFGSYASLIEELGVDDYSTTTPNVTVPSTPSTNNKTGKVYVGKAFKFGDYEISIGNNYEIVKDEKESSSHYGDDVIKLPATIKNTSDTRSHLNMYYHYYYGPSGNKLDKIMSDFGSRGEAIDYVWLDAGETKLQYFYILYDGNGKYRIEFDNHTEQKTVEFTIKK